jgi:hypothetical protein
MGKGKREKTQLTSFKISNVEGHPSFLLTSIEESSITWPSEPQKRLEIVVSEDHHVPCCYEGRRN